MGRYSSDPTDAQDLTPVIGSRPPRRIGTPNPPREDAMLAAGPADTASTMSSPNQYWTSGPNTPWVGSRNRSPVIVSMVSPRAPTTRLGVTNQPSSTLNGKPNTRVYSSESPLPAK